MNTFNTFYDVLNTFYDVLNIISVIITIIFFILCFRAFSKQTFGQILQNSKNKAAINQEIKKAEAKGLKPFNVAGIIYYAKTQAGAAYQHQVFFRKKKPRK